MPGLHYKEFIDCGQEFPLHELIHARCTDCFPEDKTKKKDVEQDLDQEGSETSSCTEPEEGAWEAGEDEF